MDNLRGAILMTLAMAGFACGDLFIKLMTETLPTWQILCMMGLAGGLVFAVALMATRQALFHPAMLSRVVLLRNLGEIVGTVGFITALSLTTFSLASTILQTTPLAVTLGAALVLKEPVGWRRWSAVFLGFAGVLIVMRPTVDGIDAGSLFALLAVAGLAVRDLTTRMVPRAVHSLQLSLMGFGALIPAGLILWAVDHAPPVAMRAEHLGYLAAAVAFIGVAYIAIVTAMRMGEISVVTPFRYSRIVFSLTLGAIVFGDVIDAPMLLGCVIIAGAGLYTIVRERKQRARV